MQKRLVIPHQLIAACYLCALFTACIGNCLGAEECTDLYAAASNRLLAHQNGRLDFKRNVWEYQQVPGALIKNSGYEIAGTKHPRKLVRSDECTCWFITDKNGARRFRWQMNNLLDIRPPQNSSAQELAEFNELNYHRNYILDETRDLTYYGLEDRASPGKLYHSLIDRASMHINPDYGQVILDTGPLDAVFSPVATEWRKFTSNRDLISTLTCDYSDSCKLRINVGSADQKLGMGEAVLSRSDFTPITVTEFQFSTGFSTPQITRRSHYYNYRTSAGSSFPSRTDNYEYQIRADQRVDPQVELAKGSTDNLLFHCYESVYDLASCRFDDSQFEKEAGFSAIDGTRVSDRRFGVLRPISYIYSDGMSEQDILQIEKKALASR
jgi:hypothetical protein